MILSEYQNIQTFWQKAMFQIGLEKVFWLKKLKTLSHGHMLFVTFKAKSVVGKFYGKNLKKKKSKGV